MCSSYPVLPSAPALPVASRRSSVRLATQDTEHVVEGGERVRDPRGESARGSQRPRVAVFAVPDVGELGAAVVATIITTVSETIWLQIE